MRTDKLTVMLDSFGFEDRIADRFYEIIRIVLLYYPIASLKFLVMRTDLLVALFDFLG